MTNINAEVLGAISSFVSEGQSFISSDVYCLLGVRIEDREYPIHQQVRDAFVQGLMPNYLSEWTTLSLEGGGHANVWRYYLPKIEVKTIPLTRRADGRVELTKEALGHFPLLDSDIAIVAKDNLIELSLDLDDPDRISVLSNLDGRVRLGINILGKANLLQEEQLIAKIFPNKIKITRQENA